MTNLLNLKLVSAPLRWTIYPLAVCVAAAAVLAAPAPQGDLPSDRELAAAAQSIGQRQQLITARLAYKDALAHDLVAGHTSLREVAELFLISNQQAPSNVDVLRQQFPGLTDLQSSAQNAIAFTEAIKLPDEEHAKVRERLNREWAELNVKPKD